MRSYLTSARSFHLSEEIAFYQGEKREKQTIDSTFQRLVRLRIKEMSNELSLQAVPMTLPCSRTNIVFITKMPVDYCVVPG